jgi:predicted nuclease of predicted toxin-antitoxin system
MKFWIDENIPRPLSNALKQAGHECFTAPSRTGDPVILKQALEANAVIVTYDHDFERYVLKENRPCAGVILVLVDAPNRWEELTARLLHLARTRESILTTSFIILSSDQRKIIPLKSR